jgi:hypothetical protein
MINGPYGQYQVGNNVYIHKLEAVYQASKTNTPVTWNFYDSVYSQLDWSQRPTGTLADMYRERAQQLRDKYDYIVVQFSGGMDSWTTLHSFLANGIHVDEVYTRWPKAERKYRAASNTNLHESNLGSEFEYAVLPVLENISKNYPRTNIVIDDYSDDLTANEFGEDALVSPSHTLTAYVKFNRKSEQELEQERKNKNIGIVLGCDKISCKVENGNFYAYFLDIATGGIDAGRNYELFFWTPDMPQIPVLQAHYLKDFYTLNNPHKNANYRRVYNDVCCPDYNPETFQVNKYLGSMIFQSNNWIYHHNPKYFKSWQWAMNQYYNSINKQYISTVNNGTLKVGLNGCASPAYLVATDTGIPNFISNASRGISV